MLITDGLFREKQGGYPVPSFHLSKQLSSATAPENRTKCWQRLQTLRRKEENGIVCSKRLKMRASRLA